MKRLTKLMFLLSPVLIVFAFGVLTKTAAKVVPDPACGVSDFSGIGSLESTAIFQDREIAVPTKILLAEQRDQSQRVLAAATPSERWIEVDLSEQKLYAWDGDQLFLESPISSGLPATPTPTGEFRVWIKLRATKMEGGEGSNYYYLPNVPYVMFFENEKVPGWRGYGIHGTYWHNDFGNPRSHGCINTPTPVAQKLFYWASPSIPEGRYSSYADEKNPGIRVIVHE